MNKTAALLILACCLSVPGFSQTFASRVKHIVDSVYGANPNSVGIMVHVESPNRKNTVSYAAGISDKTTGKKLNTQQPVLLASNTKTYVSAAILKLVEQQKLSLDGAIRQLISEKSRQALSGDGYPLDAITIRHLLSHTSGIDDYANDDYFTFVDQHRDYRWTRDEQIGHAVKVGRPLGQPGDTFRYADANYLLLTEIIEGITGKPFQEAVRSLVDYRANGLNATWFTILEPEPTGSREWAHQYWDKKGWDSYALNPSWDLYGGGGIVATLRDLSRFYYQLFEGAIVRDMAILSEMYRDMPYMKTNYRLGVRKLQIAGETAYYHGGFWGTDAAYFPALRTSIAIVILEKGKRDLSSEICRQLVVLLKNGAANARK